MSKASLLPIILLSISGLATQAQTSRQEALEGFRLISASTSTPAECSRGLAITLRAAEQNDPMALSNLGHLALSGYANIFEPDPDLAYQWLHRAFQALFGPFAEAGLTIPQQAYPAAAPIADNLLALHTSFPDFPIPAETLALAHLVMAHAHARGTNVVPYDQQASLQHFLEAARLGDPEAQAILRELLGQFPDALGPLTPDDQQMLWP